MPTHEILALRHAGQAAGIGQLPAAGRSRLADADGLFHLGDP